MKSRVYPGIHSLEEASRLRGPVLHPLAGASLQTFLDHWRRHRPFSKRSRRQRLISAFALAQRWPIALAEAAAMRTALARHEVGDAPVFIIGHWGSGTTYLHKLMSLDPAFGFLDFGHALMPWNLYGTSSYLRCYVRPLVPRDRLFDQVSISLDDPQEEEMALAAMNPVSYFNTFYFPNEAREEALRALFPETLDEVEREGFESAYRLLVNRLSLRHRGKCLLFKNPAATTRMVMLRRLFPGAKFIHLVRCPFEVYASAMNRTPYLLNGFAWQDFDDFDLSTYTIEIYRSVMKRYLRDRVGPGSDDLVEVRYEDLVSRPLDVIDTIYGTLSLPGGEVARETISNHLAASPPYRRSPRYLSGAETERIADEWGFSFDFWNYPRRPDEGETGPLG